MKITFDTTIEEIVRNSPEAVKYLMEKKIRCIRCGEPIWGTLGEVLDEKGFSLEDKTMILEELNNIIK